MKSLGIEAQILDDDQIEWHGGGIMKRVWIVLLCFWATSAMAADIRFQSAPATTGNIQIQPMDQQMFQDFSKDFAGVVLYRAVEPAAPLGLLGFNIGVEVTATQIHNGENYWKSAYSNQDPPSYIVSPRLHLQAGLPFGFDIGLAYSKVPDSNIQYAGGELKYAILKGGVVSPALAVRGSYTQTHGIDQLDFKTYGLEITVSKGFGAWFKIIPYAGIGQHWYESKPKNLTGGLQLDSESSSLTRGFIGAKLELGIFAITAEADYVRLPSYSLRAGIIW